MAGREAVGGRRSPDLGVAGQGSAHNNSPETSRQTTLLRVNYSNHFQFPNSVRFQTS